MISELEMELLHRDLDGDLTREEMESLQIMLAKNPELQLVHARLQKVSRQLADLPPVTPAFSLVDSILPVLEKEKVKAKPAPVQVASEKQELPVLVWKAQEQEALKPRRIPLWFTKVGSSIAAACLVFGLLFLMKGAVVDKGPASPTGGNAENPVSTPKESPDPGTKPPTVTQVQPVPPEKATQPANTKPKQTQAKPKKTQATKPPAVTKPPASKQESAKVQLPPLEQGVIFPGAGSSMPGATKSDIEIEPPKKADEAAKDAQNEAEDNADESKKKNADKKIEKNVEKQAEQADQQAKKAEKQAAITEKQDVKQAGKNASSPSRSTKVTNSP